MKLNSTKVVLSFLCLAATIAQAVPPVAPKSTARFRMVAQTPPAFSTAVNPLLGWPGLGVNPPPNWRSFGMPVLAQDSSSEVVYAFAAMVTPILGVITPANDECVFSNGPTWSMTNAVGAPGSLALVESNPMGPRSLGNGTQLGQASTATTPAVENLQVSSNGIVVCQTFSRLGATIYQEGIAANNTAVSLGAAAPATAMQARRSPVVDDMSMVIGEREQILPVTPFLHQLARNTFTGGFGISMNPLIIGGTGFCMQSGTATPLGGLWMPNQGSITRPASPAISHNGVIAFHGLDNFAPTISRPQIRLCNGTAQSIVMRERTFAGANATGGNYFGTISANLMATNHITAIPTPNNREMTAWQMADMRSGSASGPVVPVNSLWCRQGNFPPAYIAHVGLVAPGITPSNTMTSFYSLHVTYDPTSTMGSSVFFGANLSSGARAIYTASVSFGNVGPLQLIATNVPTITPVWPLLGPTSDIALFGTGAAGFQFSVSELGEVFFKAQLVPAVGPPAIRSVLVTASPSTTYALQTWAQSNVSTYVDPSGTTRLMTNFSITQPEQGTYSRGQAISSNGTANAPTSLIFRANLAAGNQAVVIAQ